MFARTSGFCADAREILDLCLGDRAPYSLVDFFTAAGEKAHEAARA
ncbi:hypothetical protein [Streptomyces sp. NPDC051684]